MTNIKLIEKLLLVYHVSGYLIVGSGLFGSVFAYEMTKKGKKCLVIEKRPHIGENVYTEKEYGINVHKYGAHKSQLEDTLKSLRKCWMALK